MSFPGHSRRLLLPAALLFAALCVLAAGGASAPAKTLQEKFDATQGKLSHVRENESDLTATIAEQNRAIDSMIGEVSALRQRQAAVEAELGEKQGELDAATEKLEADKRHLAEGPRPSAAGPGRPPRPPRGDLRVGQPRHAQRRPRLGELVGDERPRRLPEPGPGLRRLGCQPGQGPARRSPCRGQADDRRPPARSRTPATRSPSRSAKSPRPAPRPRRASPSSRKPRQPARPPSKNSSRNRRR